MKLLVLIIFVIVVTALDVAAQGWRGIVPLRSKRSDVERLLGQPKRPCPCASSQLECTCTYETAEGLVSVDYAPSACAGYPSGWNVSTGTVLRIGIEWNEQRDFSSLRLDESQFEMAFDDAFWSYYASRRKGVEYEVSPKKMLTRTLYFPTQDNSHLRCPCFPPLDESIQRTVKYDAFQFRSVDDNALARLDNFVLSVSEHDDSKGYVLFYRGRNTTAETALRHRRAIVKHIYRRRGFTPAKVVILDGGFQKQPTVELFRLSRESTPPEPRASWRPCKQKLPKRRAG